MSLVDLAIAATYGRAQTPDTLTLALFEGGKEVTADGYMRATVKRADWSVRNGSFSVTKKFGPFIEPCVFDRGVFFNGSDPVDELYIGATACAMSSTFEGEFVVATGEVE